MTNPTSHLRNYLSLSYRDYSSLPTSMLLMHSIFQLFSICSSLSSFHFWSTTTSSELTNCIPTYLSTDTITFSNSYVFWHLLCYCHRFSGDGMDQEASLLQLYGKCTWGTEWGHSSMVTLLQLSGPYYSKATTPTPNSSNSYQGSSLATSTQPSSHSTHLQPTPSTTNLASCAASSYPYSSHCKNSSNRTSSSGGYSYQQASSSCWQPIGQFGWCKKKEHP